MISSKKLGLLEFQELKRGHLPEKATKVYLRGYSKIVTLK